MLGTFGPCAAWDVYWPCDVLCESPAITGAAVEFATTVVWALSGRQFGYCTTTLRPCRKECYDGPWDSWTEWSGGYPTPVLLGGRWFNLTCGSCSGGSCSCTTLSEVLLPGVVNRVVEVKVDGSPLVTGAYQLYDNRTLVRTDGNLWPHCNDLNQPDTQVGTWSITSEYGQAVPSGGDWAVGELACEFIRAQNGEDCRLPRQVTQLVRQGVTISFPQITDLLKEGLTGLYLVDAFVSTWNPHRLRQRSRTYSVEGLLGRRPT